MLRKVASSKLLQYSPVPTNMAHCNFASRPHSGLKWRKVKLMFTFLVMKLPTNRFYYRLCKRLASYLRTTSTAHVDTGMRDD